MRFSAIRYALRNRNSSSTGAVIDPRSFFQSIPLAPLPRRLPWVISMGESAMKFKVKREERRRRTLSENNAFGYFGHTGMAQLKSRRGARDGWIVTSPVKQDSSFLTIRGQALLIQAC